MARILREYIRYLRWSAGMRMSVGHFFLACQTASPVMMPYIKENFANNLVMISPDAGGVPRARAYSKRLQAGLAMIDKRRDAPGKAKAMHLIGDVTGKKAVILDDIIDTGGTLAEAAKVIMDQGAESVYACCSHPVLSGPAVDRITASPLKRLVVSDTIPLSDAAREAPKIIQVSVAPLLCKAIVSIHNEDSISTLFDIHF